jgi:uncharacterized membrane protein HdeD (DUF308 family)
VRGDEVGLSGPEGSPPPTWAGVIVGGLFLVLGLLGCVATGVAAVAASESDAMVVAYFGVPLALAGLVAPIASAIVRKQQPAIAIGVPLGCGCATIVAGIVALVVFFTAIWPSL